MTGRYLVAGSSSPSSNVSVDQIVDRGLNLVPERYRGSTGVLASYWYYRKFDMSKIDSGCPLILDSGAFSAYTLGGVVHLDDYADWVLEVPRLFDFAFNLDEIGDPEGSYLNWVKLRDRGVLTVPVLHYGDRPEDHLPRYLSEGADRLALGGLVAKPGASKNLEAWTAYVHRWLRENAPQVPVHALGVHMSSRLDRFPWATTDSSSFSSAWRFGRVNLWDPDSRRWVKFEVRSGSRDAFRLGKLIRSYGFEPSEVSESTSATREALIRLVTRSECRAAEDLGSRRYLVEGSSEHLVIASKEIRDHA